MFWPTRTSGKGVNDYIALTNGDTPFDFTTQMSVSAWVRTANMTVEYQAIVTKGDAAWRIQRATTQQHLTFATGVDGNTDAVAVTNVEDDAWHHVLVTRDANTKAIYIDGALEGTRNNPPAIPTNGSAVRIGSNEDVAGRTWNGSIDEVRISATPRSAAWARAEYVMITSSAFTTFGPRETRPEYPAGMAIDLGGHLLERVSEGDERGVRAVQALLESDAMTWAALEGALPRSDEARLMLEDRPPGVTPDRKYVWITSDAVIDIVEGCSLWRA